MTEEEILKKLKIAREAWGQGYPAKGYSPYMSPTAGQEGYEDILEEKLRFLKAGYGRDARYSYGDPMKHFNDPEQIKELLEHEIVGLPPLQSGPSHFDLMRKDGVPVLSQEEIYAQQPPGGIGGGSGKGDDGWWYNINPVAGLLEGPETANMQLSPYELGLLEEEKNYMLAEREKMLTQEEGGGSGSSMHLSPYEEDLLREDRMHLARTGGNFHAPRFPTQRTETILTGIDEHMSPTYRVRNVAYPEVAGWTTPPGSVTGMHGTPSPVPAVLAETSGREPGWEPDFQRRGLNPEWLGVIDRGLNYGGF